MSRPRHIPALDGVRGIAILMVMLAHFFEKYELQQVGLLKLLHSATSLGRLGVDLFFVLSGFLITGILLRGKGAPDYLKNFYARRILRIFPLYYGVLLALFFFKAAPFGFHDLAWYALYGQNVAITFGFKLDPNGPIHFWSLAVEEHFYLVWPFLVMLVSESRLKSVLISIIGLAFGFRLLLPMFGYDMYTFTLSRMDALAAGALLAVVMAQGADVRKLEKLGWRMLLITGPLALSLYLIARGSGNALLKAIVFIPVEIMFVGFLMIALTNKSIAGLLSNKALRACGKYSYAMYIFHFIVFNRTYWIARESIAFIIGFAATFLLAYLSWHLFEKHFLNLKAKFVDRPAVSAPRDAPMMSEMVS